MEINWASINVKVQLSLRNSALNTGKPEMSSASYNFINPVRFPTEYTWQTHHKPLLSSLLLSKSGTSWDLESADTGVIKDFL